ncbi:Putative plasmid stabilization protein ParE hypothetical protein [Gloeomargarita lithophora Alchichica-D10]|uniref:Recombinase n=1 Tax=Gloeomargarita lithophora Alchichica-D10 TaxID=1188229 RepID=A0A1J0A9J2_9CYAN|nr:type II toxin-antitoxin system RelE/ParE family toxin [Gloeomargarita lithophora]APB32598.1 Putative plasmid stabilization protein ParE hypothetical protein [Gloeomargarita lithophora Alchichica-D10]
MTALNIVIIPAAERELAESYSWYEEQEIGLGEDYLRCVDACIQAIQKNPELYQVVYLSYRRAVVRRFPYVIFYECADNSIIIYAVFHCAQDPNKWRKRLPSS